MRLPLVTRLLGLLVIFASPIGHLCASPVSHWQEIRNHQPTALHVKLVFQKEHYFQGEKIDATLKFSNGDEAHPYALKEGAVGPGATFFAADTQGNPVVDPLEWYNDWYGGVYAGRVASHLLGRFSLTTPINETLRFDKPGQYKVYAQSIVTKGTSAFTSRETAAIVSDEVQITIVPLDPAREKAVISEALKKISRSDPSFRSDPYEGMLELDYLQTPSARAELVKLLARPELVQFAQDGLLAAPDPAAEGADILRRVKAGKLVLDINGVWLYGVLANWSLVQGRSSHTLSLDEARAAYQKLLAARTATTDEVLAAAIQSSVAGSLAHIEALWAAFQDQAIHKNPWEADRDGGKARAAMVAHQLELPEAHVNDLINGWASCGSPDFLPLIRQQSNPPAKNFRAFVVLAGLRPDEARACIIKDLASLDSSFLKGDYPASRLLPTFPPMPLPQFDSLFETKLAQAKGQPSPIIPVIGTFGSPALLPSVVKAYEQYGRDPAHPWDNGVLKCLFLYWLRCDPAPAATALERAIQSRGAGGWMVLRSVLGKPWIDQEAPVARWALQAPDINLVNEAISILERYAGESSIDPIIATLEQHAHDQDAFCASAASRLLETNRWHLAERQTQRLQALAAASPHK